MKQQQENVVSYDRELEGPHAYDKYNNISKTCQVRYLNLIRAQTLILMVMALICALPFPNEAWDNYMRYALVALSVIILGIIVFQQNKNYMKGWQNARFIAESVLSNAWLFCFKIGSYNGTESSSIKSYVDNVDKIESEVELKSFLAIYSSQLPAVSDWMKEQFNESDIIKKRDYYVRYRLDNQISWYTKKSQFNGGQSNTWFVISLGLLLIGIILTLFVHLSQFSVVGFLSTVTSGILTWRQTKRFDELKVTYAVAAKELHSLKSKFEVEVVESELLKMVEECEKSISREHKLWFNWTYIS